MQKDVKTLPTFVELPPFQRVREQYLGDDSYRELQQTLISNPEAGDVIKGAGGLRKLRYVDQRRGKGKRGGLRVIFYYWLGGPEFWLFTVYDKDEADDLTKAQRDTLQSLVKTELAARNK